MISCNNYFQKRNSLSGIYCTLWSRIEMPLGMNVKPNFSSKLFFFHEPSSLPEQQLSSQEDESKR